MVNDYIIADMNKCPYSRKNGMYGGAAGYKEGVIYNNDLYLIKYPKNIRELNRTGGASYSTAPLSEYLGSHIFDILGYDVHETLLAERNGKIVVACKDFATDADLLEIRTIKNVANNDMADIFDKSFSSTGSQHFSNLEELLLHLEYNPILRKVDGIKERFWEQAVVDVFINNNDRNNGNWGLLRDRDGNDSLAPIFDNGGSFQTKISEEKIHLLLNNPQLLYENASNTQTGYGVDGHILSSKKFLELSTIEKGLSDAILKVVPLISERMNDIRKFVQVVPEKYHMQSGEKVIIFSQERKQMYLLQMQERYKTLLYPVYEKLLKERMSTIKDSLSFEERLKNAEIVSRKIREKKDSICVRNINDFSL